MSEESVKDQNSQAGDEAGASSAPGETDASPAGEQETVPYARFQEVVGQKNVAQQQVESLTRELDEQAALYAEGAPGTEEEAAYTPPEDVEELIARDQARERDIRALQKQIREQTEGLVVTQRALVNSLSQNTHRQLQERYPEIDAAQIEASCERLNIAPSQYPEAYEIANGAYRTEKVKDLDAVDSGKGTAGGEPRGLTFEEYEALTVEQREQYNRAEHKRKLAALEG